MAKLKGYNLIMPATTSDNRDKYAVADANDIRGGVHSVKTINEMLSIPYLRRKVGMYCYVSDEKTMYRLASDDKGDTTILDDWRTMKDPVDPKVLDTFVSEDELKNTYLTKYLKKTDFVNSDGTLIDISNLASKNDLENIRKDIPDVSEYALKKDLIDPSTGKHVEIGPVIKRQEQLEKNIANFYTYLDKELNSIEFKQEEIHVDPDEVPKTVEFHVKNYDKAYKYPCVEILKKEKLESTETYFIHINDFERDEEPDFNHDSNVAIDGDMHIVVNNEIKMSEPEVFNGEYYLSYSEPIPYDRLKNAKSIVLE